jgi:hypothetical protein
MDDILFTTPKEREKFKNNLMLSSLAQLSAEKRAASIVTGKRRPDFTIENNFIAGAEKEIKRRNGDESALSRLYTNCFFRRLNFINKHLKNRYSEESLLFSKAIYSEQLALMAKSAIAMSMVVYGFYRAMMLQRSNRMYLYYGIGLACLFGYIVGKYSSEMTRR